MMQQLGIFSYEDNCKKLLKGEINNNRIPLTLNNKIINKLSKEIAFCIKQGIHFFNSAETASITISPLLLYYGILSLSKALIIANSNGTIFLNDIKYHGLSTRPLTDKQKKFKEIKNNWKLLNEYANVNDGVFFKLYKLMSKTTKLKKMIVLN